MRNDTVIQVEGLGKCYQLGHVVDLSRTLREQLMSLSFWGRRSAKRAEAEDGGPRHVGGTKKHVFTETSRPADHSEYFWALKDVCFEINQGEVVGIIGCNGAGKSTLLKILARITAPTTGEAVLKGRVGSLLEVGTGFHPELTGRENIYLNGAIIGMEKGEIERKFNQIVAFAEVEKFIDTPVKRYSSGMRVRLAFAVAAHLEPEILLVDEVLAVGDAAFQKKCLGKMSDVSKSGHTILFVSHNMGAVRKLCSKCIYLDQNRMVQFDETEAVISAYLSETVSEISSEVKFFENYENDTGGPLRLGFYANDGKPSAQFRLREKWRIVLEFEMTRDADEVVAAVGITTFESVPLMTYWSKPQDLAPGRYAVAFECDVALRSLDLQFNVGLSSRGYNFFFVSGVGHVTISDVAVGHQPFRTSSKGGILLTEQDCSIYPLRSNINSEL